MGAGAKDGEICGFTASFLGVQPRAKVAVKMHSISTVKYLTTDLTKEIDTNPKLLSNQIELLDMEVIN